MATTYGYKRTNDCDVRQVWDLTKDPEDMLLPDSQFVACETAAEALLVLQRRCPVPDDLNVEDERVFVSRYHSQRIIVSTYPIVTAGEIDATSSFVRSAQVCVARCGGLTIAPEEHPEYRGYADNISRNVSQLRGCEAFRASDLVVRQSRDIDWYWIAQSPVQAKRRKSTDSNREARVRAENAKHAARQASIHLLKTRVYNPAETAIAALWHDCPILDAVTAGPPATDSWGAGAASDSEIVQIVTKAGSRQRSAAFSEPIASFFRMVGFHEQLRGSGRWRRLPAVQEFLHAGTNDEIVKLLGADGIDPYSHSEGIVERYCREALRAKRAAASRAGRAAKQTAQPVGSPAGG